MGKLSSSLPHRPLNHLYIPHHTWRVTRNVLTLHGPISSAPRIQMFLNLNGAHFFFQLCLNIWIAGIIETYPSLDFCFSFPMPLISQCLFLVLHGSSAVPWDLVLVFHCGSQYSHSLIELIQPPTLSWQSTETSMSKSLLQTCLWILNSNCLIRFLTLISPKVL